MHKRYSLILLCLIVFAALCIVGFNTAVERRVWNDEINTQFKSIRRFSQLDMYRGKIKEGNKSPLFYSLQKMSLHFFSHNPTKATIDSLESRIVLRVVSILSMALAVVLIFYFFSYHYSFWIGGVSLILSLTSFMVWAYMCEARPYALWFLLTTIQSLLLITVIKDKRQWIWLALSNLLLSLTVVFSLVQIVAVSIVYWIIVERRWTRFVWLTVIPISLCLYYFASTPNHKFYFKESPLAVFTAGMPLERMALIGLFGLCSILAYFKKFKFSYDLLDKKNRNMILGYLGMALLTIGGFLMILIKFKVSEQMGFAVSNRYFIGLTPISIIGITLFAVWIRKLNKGVFMSYALVGIFVGLIGVRCLKYIL